MGPQKAFHVLRHVSDMSDAELLDRLLAMASWWYSNSERAPLREEILRRMARRNGD